MPQVNPEIEAFARIRVVGVGGSGTNAINHMMENKMRGVDFVVINTDAQDLHNSLSKKKIHIGKNLTRGLGAGMNPDIGKRAAALYGAQLPFLRAETYDAADRRSWCQVQEVLPRLI